MRNNGQKQRMRGRNRKSHNPLGRLYESNGPDVKIRGTAAHVAEKYVQLARDAQSSGDPVAAENYYQHAEHYFRLIAAAQEQFRQTQPFYRPDNDTRDEGYEDEGDQPGDVQGGPREPQQVHSREQPYGLREPQPYTPRPPQQLAPAQAQAVEEGGTLDRLPSFITGQGSQPQAAAHQGPNGFDPQGERFAHRRRRRHRGPRPDVQGGADSTDEAPPPPPAD